MLKKTILTAALASVSLSSYGAIAIDIQADTIKNQFGAAAPIGSLAFLIASTTDSLFANLSGTNLSTSIGTLVGGSDDYIVAKIQTSDWADVGAFEASFRGVRSLNLAGVPGWSAGDPLALVWLADVPSTATTIPDGAKYGFFTSAVSIVSDGSAAWVTPTDGNDVALAFVTTDGGIYSPGGTASNAPSAGINARAGSVGSAQSVPEPTSAFLVAVGAAGLMMRRRRQS